MYGPKYLGRERRGTRLLIMTRAPELTPAPPIPVMARPTMSAAELGAVAETMEPISKIATSMTRAWEC